MHKTVELHVEKDILEANRRAAVEMSERLREHSVKSYDFMGSIGSGKTTIIEKLVEMLKKKNIKAAAVVGDVAGDDDYRRIKAHGIQVENVNTGKECHLDCHLIEHAIEHIDLDEVDVLFIENVGNLVCPADFPLGTEKRIVIISTTEGDDIIRKHPVIFTIADIAVLNKVDIAEYVDVDVNVMVGDYRRIKPHGKLTLTDAKHDVGLDELIDALEIL